jgi:hypothetical protein
MAAPKGNKYALGCTTSGKPRKTSFAPKEMEKLGNEMVVWLKNTMDVLHLSEWYTIEKGFTYNEWKTFIQRKEFIPYYEIALKIVGKQYLDKNSNVIPGISQRWQRVYFKDLKEQEDSDASEEIERQSTLLNNTTPPLQDDINKDHEIMRLKHEIQKLKKNADKR